MTWALNCFYPQKSTTACSATIKATTPEEAKSYPMPKKGWRAWLDNFVNRLAIPIFVQFRTVANLVLRRSPDLGVVEPRDYCSKNRFVIKEMLKLHRNDPEDGICDHSLVSKGMTHVMSRIFPKISANDIILTCNPGYTKIYREFLTHFFSPLAMLPYLGEVQEIVQKAASFWSRKDRIVLNHETKLLGSQVMAQIFLGYSESSDKVSLASGNIVPWISETLFATMYPLYQKLLYYIPRIAFVSASAKEETVKALREAVKKSMDDASKPDAKESLVKQMVLTLYVAGQDNVSTALTYCLLKLAQIPSLQEEVRKEKGDDPMQSVLIRSIIYEGLRMICPVGGIGRGIGKQAVLSLKDEKGEELSKTLLQPNERIQLLTGFVANDPKLYPNPARFDPSRHAQQSSFLPSIEFMPFGEGMHRCPGWYLFYAVAVYTIWYVAKNYTLKTNFKGEPRTAIRFVTQITDKITITLNIVPENNQISFAAK
jgi:cytochrome P450